MYVILTTKYIRDTRQIFALEFSERIIFFEGLIKNFVRPVKLFEDAESETCIGIIGVTGKIRLCHCSPPQDALDLIAFIHEIELFLLLRTHTPGKLYQPRRNLFCSWRCRLFLRNYNLLKEGGQFASDVSGDR